MFIWISGALLGAMLMLAAPAAGAWPAATGDLHAAATGDGHTPAAGTAVDRRAAARLAAQSNRGLAAEAGTSTSSVGTLRSASPPTAPLDPDDPEARLARLSPIQMDEVLWLARCMYSESDRPNEQELVAWVIRNRVETEYRGRTYREVVLEARQFSAFNAPTKRRAHILSLTPDTPLRSWQRTLEIALDVYEAAASERPFAQTVRHFYSPVSMVGGREPHWADGGTPLSSAQLGVDERRFIFFDDVDPQFAGTGGTAPSIGGGSHRSGAAEGPGLSIQLRRPSGKVSRPRRPAVVPPRAERRF